MGDRTPELDQKQIDFIAKQHIYFVGTAAQEGSVNISPKGMDSFRVINDKRVVWLNLTGSGNETAAHLLENKRMTIMFCSFDKQPLILRLYGHAKTIHPRDGEWNELIKLFPDYLGARQVFDMQIELVQNSCGYAVPFYELKSERLALLKTDEKKGRDGIKQYWKDRNQVSLDGKETGVIKS